jgi:hypothetical protein
MNPLQIALAIYGGYKGYKSAKKSGASGLGRIFGTALGAYGGYSLGSGITSLGGKYLPSALTQNVSLPASLSSTFQNIPGAETIFGKAPVADVTKGIGAFNTPPGIDDLSQVGVYQPTQGISPTNLPVGMTQEAYDNLRAGTVTRPGMTDTQIRTLGENAGGVSGGGGGQKEKSLAERIFFKTKTGGGEEFNTGAALGLGLPALLYGTGAFETEPYERSMFTYNVGYPELYRGRKFYTQDPKTGEVRELSQQDYIPEESAAASVTKEGDRFGPYKRETITLQQGGLATLSHFKDGGVNYLPSKTVHDEDDEDNYMRTNGYVEDGAGNGDKEEDTMLAQLADGEFVTRTDGVLGAGILAGASPKDPKEMRKLGAEFFYEQQKRFKRIYDLLDASRKARAN